MLSTTAKWILRGETLGAVACEGDQPFAVLYKEVMHCSMWRPLLLLILPPHCIFCLEVCVECASIFVLWYKERQDKGRSLEKPGRRGSDWGLNCILCNCMLLVMTLFLLLGSVLQLSDHYADFQETLKIFFPKSWSWAIVIEKIAVVYGFVN